jgi:hypothetical protein
LLQRIRFPALCGGDRGAGPSRTVFHGKAVDLVTGERGGGVARGRAGATQEAVTSYRSLAKTRPDAFLPDLATSLNNLGFMLSELGRREDALAATQEAVTIHIVSHRA